MALTLKIGQVDLSEALRVAHEDELTPAPSDYLEPQFTGAAALGDGSAWVGDSVQNKQQQFPLLLRADTSDELYAYIRQIRAALAKGEQVEYRSGQATRSTFWRLERGRLTITYQHWLDQGGLARCQLELWTRPYGSTGTSRVIATSAGAGLQMLRLPALDGDVPASLGLEVSVPSGYSQFSAVGWGVKHDAAPGWEPQIPAASIGPASVASSFYAALPWTPLGAIEPQVALTGLGDATVVGASGRTASQYSAMRAATYLSGHTYWYSTEAGQVTPLAEVNLPQDVYAGRYRMLGVVRSLVTGAGDPRLLAHLQSWAAARDRPVEIGHVPLTGGTHWRLEDFGELEIPAPASGSDSMYRILLSYYYRSGAIGGAVAGATWPIHIDNLTLLPLDEAGLWRDSVYRLDPAGGELRIDGAERQVRLGLAVNGATAPVIDADHAYLGGWPQAVPAASGSSVLVVVPGHSPDASGAVWYSPSSMDRDFVQTDQRQVTVTAVEQFSYLR